ncbi:MAG: Imidazolonepropionase [Candidatus Dichloromethanomonas elyunquensis]|nr:MAG: Imidazolonepropionase [Candidatus Dichloromethanomonas elyunquensis]
MPGKIDLLVRNIGLLATPLGNEAKGGKKQSNILLIQNAYIAVSDGRIIKVGIDNEYNKDISSFHTRVIDAKHSLVTPGLVDAHTHLIFAGWRQKELSLKLKGYTYLDILKQGGGILSTVQSTRKASLEELVENGSHALDIMLAHGTTTCEVKSGYGLTVEDELKSLQAIRELHKSQNVELAATFMGAHAIPEEFKNNKKGYIELICTQMIPQVAKQGIAEFCDVFCEDSVFDLAESRQILKCGKSYGLIPKIHADEITSMGGARIAGEVAAISAEHLIHAGEEELEAMSHSNTIAVLLPGTSLYLGEDFAQAMRMKELNIPVAIATDFNPGSCPTESLQLPMTLACLKYKLSPEEVLTAVTLNAAAAVARAEQVGTIEKGKQADFVIWNAPDLEFLFYHYGVNLVNQVIKKGRIVVDRSC